jgi:hypothetical protein
MIFLAASSVCLNEFVSGPSAVKVKYAPAPLSAGRSHDTFRERAIGEGHAGSEPSCGHILICKEGIMCESSDSASQQHTL